ncbi:MAG: hypothetical protein ACYS8L_04040 [Planctomycetota bacterium]|jgi:hypothetical protein
MSTSEQGIKSQVAEMRQALRSARASARTGKIIYLLGVVAGLAIVAIYVVLFLTIIQSVAEPQRLGQMLQERFDRIQLDEGLQTVIEVAGPEYLAGARELLEGLDLPDIASRELQTMLRDLEPVLLEQLQRVRPRLERMIEIQKDKTLQDLEGLLRASLGERLADAVGRHEADLGEGTGLDEEGLAQLVIGLQTASADGLAQVIMARRGDLENEMKKMGALLSDIPPLPPQSQEAVLEDLGRVLVALLKENLPGYEFEAELPVLQPPVMRPGPPAEVLERVEKARGERGPEAAAPSGPKAAAKAQAEAAMEAGEEARAKAKARAEAAAAAARAAAEEAKKAAEEGE